MKKILYIGNSLEEKFGGGVVSKRNYSLLLSLNYKVEKIELYKNKLKPKIINYLPWKSLGINKGIEDEILSLIEREKYDVIFFDGSLWGNLIKKIKNKKIKIKIISFFHNIELSFLKERIKCEGKKYFALSPFFYFNEKKTVKYSDYVITLNERDSKLLKKIYSRASSLELPISLEKKELKYKEENKKSENEILFIGSNFFANYQGIKWFVNTVMKDLKGYNLKIVGKGFESHKNELTRKNVEVVGTVDSLEEYYKNAMVVVAPIFFGGGMKVKTIEALSYGKYIIGTKEAFQGIKINKSIGKICTNETEFLKAFQQIKIKKYNKESRIKFEIEFSNNVIEKKIKNFFKNEVNNEKKIKC